jgi:glycine betaine/choline ABC-type transport system substrate-binding protein
MISKEETEIMKNYRNGLIIGYILLVIVFFIAEIGAQLNIPLLSSVRATNQVLILLGLLFFPFLLSSIVSLIQRLKVTVAGVEVDAEFSQIKGKIEAIETEQFQLSGRVDNTQQVFLSILRGKDPSAIERIDSCKLDIGCKDFDEQKLLSQILSQHIMGSLKVECRCLIPNGGTLKNYFDLVNEWIDGYIEYTGTGCMLLGVDPKGSPDTIRNNLNERSKALGHRVEWLEPLGFANNYVIIVKKDHLKNVHAISNLEHKAKQLIFAGDMEFMNRSDGYPGLCNSYRLDFRKKVVCSYRDRYRLLKEKKVDVIVGFQTDPELNDNDLIPLKDPKIFFPEYYALPVFRKDALKKN